jgi:hypothetical protein
MLENILNLEGAQQLSKNEQKEINGGIPPGCQLVIRRNVTLFQCNLEGGTFYAGGTCRVLVCSPEDPIEIFVP